MAAILKVDILQSTDGVSKIILDNMPSGYVLASTIIRNSTRTSVSGAASGVLFSGSFTKQRSDTNIVATCTVFGAQYSAGNCAVGLRLDTSWDYGCAYQYDGQWGTSQTTIIVGQGYWTGIGAGSRTMAFGWNTINNESGNRPFAYLNPNNVDDSRNQQMVSSIIIYEVYP